MRSFSTLYEVPRYLSNENFTSSAVTSSPLWNFAPLRRTNSYVRASSDAVHDSARLGASGWPGIGFTMASCNAYITMKGMTVPPDVSAGSNHAGARETCTPQVSCPCGLAVPAEPVEGKTPEPASTADIFRISRRVRSPTEQVAILSPFSAVVPGADDQRR